MRIDHTTLSPEAKEYMEKKDSDSIYFTENILLWKRIRDAVIEKSTTKKEYKLCKWLVENDYVYSLEEAFEDYIKPHRKKVKKSSKQSKATK